jgi:hypothetical protein
MPYAILRASSLVISCRGPTQPRSRYGGGAASIRRAPRCASANCESLNPSPVRHLICPFAMVAAVVIADALSANSSFGSQTRKTRR